MQKAAMKILMLAVAVALIIAMTACKTEKKDDTAVGNKTDQIDQTDNTDQTSGDVIKIGVLVPLTDSEAYYGNDMFNSYKLAAEEINDEGGILGKKIEFFEADDACNANTASLAATKIISQGVDFVIGGYCSGATIPALQLFNDENLIMLISAANSTRITELGLTQSFMLNSPGSHAVITLADLCKSLGAANVALIHQGDDYTQNLSDLCQDYLPTQGIAIASVDVMEQKQADVSAIVTSILNSGADFVYWCGYHADGSNMIKQLLAGGYTGYICVGDGSASVELIEACGEAGEGVYLTSPPFVRFAEGGEKFMNSYRAKYGVEPGTYATLAYDTVYLLKNAVESVGTTDFEAVRDAIQNIEYKGLSGFIKFTPDRELEISNFMVLQIQDGDFALVELN